MIKVPNSVLLIDNNEIDIFINKKTLENFGVKYVHSFNNAITALIHLRSETKKYDLILVDIYLPVMDGFEFIDSFNKSELYKTHDKICLLSSTLDPQHVVKAKEKNISLMQKPLNIKELLLSEPP